MSTVIEILIVVAFVIYTGDALTCFHCDQIPFPRDCKTVVKCGPHEECYTERIITDDGNVYFNTGCKDRQKCIVRRKRSVIELPRHQKRQGSFETTVCDSCCGDDHCNYGGCGADPLPPADQRGPICYNCAAMKGSAACNQVTLCGRDQMCEVLKTPHPTFDVTYTTKCGTKALCDRLMGAGNIFGRRSEYGNQLEKRGSLCFRCCKGDLCNLGCTSPTTVSTTTTKTAATTTASTAKTTVSSTASSTSTTAATTTTAATISSTTGSTVASTMGSTTASTTTSSTLTSSGTTATAASSMQSSQTTNPTSKIMSTLPHSTMPTNASNHGCLPDYIYYGSSCYYFSTSSLYWAPARKFCKDHGSDLAIITDATEDNLIVQHLKQLTAQHMLPSDLWGFYIGAHIVNGTWKWVDNTDLTFTNWATSEPDKPASHIYASIFVPSSGYYNYQWASHKDMYTTSYFICEFKPTP